MRSGFGRGGQLVQACDQRHRARDGRKLIEG